MQPRRYRAVEKVGGAEQRPLRRRKPSRAERIGGQPDQRVAARFPIGTRKCGRPAVPGASPVVPAELAQKRRAGAVGQRYQRAGLLTSQQGEVGQRAAVSALTAGHHRPQP